MKHSAEHPRGDELRQASVDDLAAMESLIQVAYAKYLPRMDRAPAPMLRSYADDVADRIVWVRGDPIDAMVTLRPTRSSLLIENAAVAPPVQGRGLGRLLIEFAEQVAVSSGFDQLSLYTNEAMTENIDLYTHLGFREVNRRDDGGYRRVFMAKDLSPPHHVSPSLQ